MATSVLVILLFIGLASSRSSLEARTEKEIVNELRQLLTHNAPAEVTCEDFLDTVDSRLTSLERGQAEGISAVRELLYLFKVMMVEDGDTFINDVLNYAIDILLDNGIDDINATAVTIESTLAGEQMGDSDVSARMATSGDDVMERITNRLDLMERGTMVQTALAQALEKKFTKMIKEKLIYDGKMLVEELHKMKNNATNGTGSGNGEDSGSQMTGQESPNAGSNTGMEMNNETTTPNTNENMGTTSNETVAETGEGRGPEEQEQEDDSDVEDEFELQKKADERLEKMELKLLQEIERKRSSYRLMELLRHQAEN